MSKKTVTKADAKAAGFSGISVQDLPFETKGFVSASPVEFALWMRSLLQNWRQGTVGCKGRSDVNRSNKKPWKQKGTGRARAGSARSPLWRGGGVIFGPQPRVRQLSVSKKIKTNVLGTLVYTYAQDSKIRCLDFTPSADVPKTSVAYAALKQAGLHNAKVTFFMPVDDMVTYASFVNIPNVRIVFFDQPNAFDLAASDYWVVCTKDVDSFKEMATRWI